MRDLLDRPRACVTRLEYRSLSSRQKSLALTYPEMTHSFPPKSPKHITHPDSHCTHAHTFSPDTRTRRRRYVRIHIRPHVGKLSIFSLKYCVPPLSLRIFASSVVLPERVATLLPCSFPFGPTPVFIPFLLLLHLSLSGSDLSRKSITSLSFERSFVRLFTYRYYL